MRSGYAVAGFKRLLNGPFLINRSAGIHDASQRVFKPFAVMRLLANHHVGQQAELSAAPVCASPGVCAVQSLIGAAGITFGHVPHHVCPYLLRRQKAALDTRDWLYV